jgi:hypothetical protein
MKLGKIQKQMMDSLVRHGSWKRGCGWYCGTSNSTQRYMDQLVAKGLVEIDSRGAYIAKPQGDK